MKQYLESIFNYDKSVTWGKIEETGQEAILPYRIKYKKYKVLVYGTGSKACYIFAWLKKHDILVEFFIDGNKEKSNSTFLKHEVVWLDDVKTKLKDDLSYLVIIGMSIDYCLNDIRKKLYMAGIDEIHDIERNHIWGNSTANWQSYFLKNREKLLSILDILGDEESQKVLCEYLRGIFMDDFYRLPQEDSKEKYFGEGFIRRDDCENFICIGASSGDTVFYFLEKYKHFGKIYCFEGEQNQYGRLKNNLNVLPQDIQNKIYIIPKYVGKKGDNSDIVGLDDAGVDDASLISMDIEGMELEALQGAKRLIQTHTPILALSAYHKKEDICDFVEYIRECSDDYVFYLRKYAALHKLSKNEIVLYAVPEDRILKE